MSRRKFASNQLLLAEDELIVLTRWADEVGMQLGVIADDIHFAGREPVAVDGLIDQVDGMRRALDRAAGLLAAYEIHRRSQIMMREAAHDDSSAG